ncbi:MAG: hypothetical protein RDV48_31025 [Candidatus Eremiobacteraeota bacterium]|nr:hypothetical protein [Candidatus Eremiobacteraeota bacterium]
MNKKRETGWNVIISPQAEKAIKKLIPREQARVRSVIDTMEPGKPGQIDLKKMPELDLWRLRIGRWRAVLHIDFKKQIVWMLDFGARGDVYK